MKIGLIKDEWYPVYSTWRRGMAEVVVDIPLCKAKWIRKVEKEFLEVQIYLEEQYDKENDRKLRD